MRTLLPQALPASARRTAVALSLALVAGVVPSYFDPAGADQPTGDAEAVGETAPVSEDGVASDPAIWVNGADPAQSLIIGASDQGGLEVYDLSGATVQTITGEGNPVTVDLRRGVSLGGNTVDVVATAGEGSVRFYTVDGAAKKLTNVTAGGAVQPALPSGGGQVEGVCLYQSRPSGVTYAFVNAPSGQLVQLELVASTADPGKIETKAVRGGQSGPWDVTSATSSPIGGCVADDELHTLYVSERNAGIWKFGAEPGDPTTAAAVDAVAPDGHLVPKVQGLALVRTGEGTGYLFASSQGSDTTDERDAYMVYRREGANEFVRTFHVTTGAKVDNCQRSTGIDAVAENLGPAFPAGIFVCSDAHNTATGGAGGGNQDYKLVALEAVAEVAPPPAGPTPTTTPAGPTTPTTAPGQTQGTNRSGYWMVGADGRVYPFGDASPLGDADGAAADIEPTPSGNGYWIVDATGRVTTKGDARTFGTSTAVGLGDGEQVTSLSSTPSGNGYWLFTNKGRVLPFGDAAFHGDMSAVRLNGPVLDSIPTRSGAGYYMVASDGGIFSFGDAGFYGSMGSVKLNAPVQSLVPDGDGRGYWLVAGDGGIFAFQAPFRGSMGASKLSRPVTGMVRFGDGYLMVAEDGGIFNFSDRQFHGSLGADPPDHPIVSVAALDAP